MSNKRTDKPVELPFIEGLVINRKDNLSRYERRKMWFEYRKIYNALIPVEERFYQDIFMSDEENRYNDIYTFYLDQFIHNLKYIKHAIKPKYLIPNVNYFEIQFKPIEHELPGKH